MAVVRALLLPVRLLLWLPRLLLGRVLYGELRVSTLPTDGPRVRGGRAAATPRRPLVVVQRRGGRRARAGLMRGRGQLLVAAMVVVALVTAAVAVAFFTATGAGSGAARAGHLNPPTDVTVPTTNSTGTVHVSWTGSVSGGAAVTPEGYYVERNDGGASWSLACGSDATTNLITSGTICDDTGLSSGSYTYRVTAVFHNWTALSDASGSVTVTITVDNTPPDVHVTDVSGSPVTFPYSTNATITSIGGTCGTAPGDLAPVDWSIDGQSGTATCSGGDWSSGPLTTISAEGGYTATASQDDSASNHGSDSVMITIDTTSPVVSITSVNGSLASFPKLLNVNVTSVGGACGVLSGDSATIDVSVTGAATLSDTATCSAGAWTYTFSSPLSAEGDYTVTATQADAAGNSGSSGAKTITIDKTAPITSITIDPSSPNGSNGWYTGTNPTFTLSPTDTGGSGVASTNYQIDSGTITTYPGSAVAIPDGQHTISYWSTDNAGNVETTHTTATIKVDTVNPTGGAITANGSGSASYNATGTIALTKTDFGDGGSGIASNVITRATATLSGNTCGSFSGATVVPTLSDSGLSTACYRYTLTGTDTAGNSATVTSAIVKVDTSPPTAPIVTPSAATGSTYINGSTVFINPQATKSGGFTVTATSTDADTLIQKINFPALTGFTSPAAATTPTRPTRRPTPGRARPQRPPAPRP